jgi:hypothetical protein
VTVGRFATLLVMHWYSGVFVGYVLGDSRGLEVCCVAVKLSQEEEKKKRSRGVGAPELHVLEGVGNECVCIVCIPTTRVGN